MYVFIHAFMNVFTDPSTRVRCDTKSISKQSLTGLNS